MIIGYLYSCSNPANFPLEEKTETSNNLRDANTLIKSDVTLGIPLLVVGDSLSAAYGMMLEQSWVHLLAQRLKERGYQVINASISGDTTGSGQRRLTKVLQEYQPKIVVLELGANDGLRGLSLKQMQNNLAGMIKESQEMGAKVLLLGMRIPSNYGKAYTQHFHQIYQDLAAAYQVSFVPFFLEGVALNRTLIQNDGLHLTATAQSQLLENVWIELERMLRMENASANIISLCTIDFGFD